MPNGQRRVEEIHLLPDDMADLPIEGQVLHMARMLESYLGRLFYHVGNVEDTLTIDGKGVLSRLGRVEEFQTECKKQDPIDHLKWVRQLRARRERIMTGLSVALLVEGAALIYALIEISGG